MPITSNVSDIGTGTGKGNMTTAGALLDSAISTVSTAASTAVNSAVLLVSSEETPEVVDTPTMAVSFATGTANSTNSTGPSWVDSTFRTADATLLVFAILASIFVIAAFRGDHLTPPSMKMATEPLLAIVVFFEAVFISNLWAYAFKLIPCVFTECLVNAEDAGSAAGVASILYIVIWSLGFMLLIGMKLAGWRGISIFERETDELTGMFGGI